MMDKRCCLDQTRHARWMSMVIMPCQVMVTLAPPVFSSAWCSKMQASFCKTCHGAISAAPLSGPLILRLRSYSLAFVSCTIYVYIVGCACSRVSASRICESLQTHVMASFFKIALIEGLNQHPQCFAISRKVKFALNRAITAKFLLFFTRCT